MSVREPGDYRANVRDRYSHQPRYRSPGSGRRGAVAGRGAPGAEGGGTMPAATASARSSPCD